MRSFKGALVLAGACAAVGLGCSHYRSSRPYKPASETQAATTQTSQTSRTTQATQPVQQPAPATEPTATPSAPAPGTEMGTGGAGQYTGGLPSSTPTTTTPSEPSTGVPAQQPSIGGSGVDIRNQGMNPDACNRNQIGSPNSSDVICDHNNMQTGQSGVSGRTTSTGTSSGTLSSEELTPGGMDAEKALGEKLKRDREMKKSGTGGSGLDESAVQTTQTTETKKITKHKKHVHKKSESGTGGSGPAKSTSKETSKDTSKDTSSQQSGQQKSDQYP